MDYIKAVVVGFIAVLVLFQFSSIPYDGARKENTLDEICVPSITGESRTGESRTGESRTGETRFSPETDVPTWSVGDWWEYDSTVNNTWPETGEYLNLGGTIRYTVDGVEMFAAADGISYLAYNLSVSGGYRGNALYDTTELIINGARFSQNSTTPGEARGYRVLRVSDLAILKEETFIEGFVHYDAISLKFIITESMFDLKIVDVFDLPLTPGESFNFSTRQNRSFSLYLTEMGYYLRKYSEVFPFSYEMSTSALNQLTTPAGTFEIYKFTGISLTSDDPSTMNHSYSPAVKSFVKQDVYRITLTDHENHSVLDTVMELTGYHVDDITNIIDTNTDMALFNMPIEVNGSFPGHPSDEVVVTFPYTGTIVETTTDGEGLYSARIVTPGIHDNSPSDHDLSSFGVCAYVKNNLNEIVTKSIVIIASDDIPPVADAGEDQTINEGETVTLNGDDSSDDLAVKNYSWSLHHNDTLVKLFGESPSFLFSHPGTYAVTLNVSDYGNNADTDICEIVVKDTTPPLIVLPHEIVADEGDTVFFNGSGCLDPESGSIAGYEWRFIYNNTNVILSGEKASYLFEIPGIYAATLSIVDLSGNNATRSFHVIVTDITPPMAKANSDTTGPQGMKVIFNSSFSTDNVGIVNWTWRFAYDGKEIILYGKIANFTFRIVGNYTITLEICDSTGLKGTNHMWVNVTDTTPPLANGGENLTVDEQTLVTFDGSGSTDNVGVSNYTWTFFYSGFEQVLYGKKTVFRFVNVGTYAVILTASDAAGNTANDTLFITVTDVTPPVPPGGLDLDCEINEGERVDLGAGDWSDNGSKSLRYEWSFTYDGKLTNVSGNILDFDFEEPQKYEIALTVTNDAGLATSIKFHINVVDTSPETPIRKITVNEGIVLDIRVPDDFVDMDIETCYWSLSDSKGKEFYVKNGSTRFHYDDELEPGIYEITLTVEDKDGYRVRHTFTVEVKGIAEKEEAREVELSSGICFGIAGVGALVIIIIIIVIISMNMRGSRAEKELKKAEAVEVEPMEVVVLEYICPECEKVIDENDETCPHCGEKLVEED